MILNETNCFKLFSKIQKNVISALGREPRSHHDEFSEIIEYRTWLIFRLDLLLFTYREKVDPQRLVLTGRRSLDSYLASNHGIPLHIASTYSLDDVMVLLFEEISSLSIEERISNYLKSQSEYQLPERRLDDLTDGCRKFRDAEWDPDLADKRLL